MADVSGKFFSAKKVRTGVSPSSPGVIVGETLPPVNPPGGGLNSVGLTMPAAFAVANSPLTSNGTIEVTGAGTSSQFVKGDGSLDSTAYGTGSVTSVGLTMPSAFNVGSSPITTNGTLAVTGAGTTAQYVRGDGSLATFPALTGFVPYTGATADVNLGTHDLTAERGTFENNGSSDTLTVNHTSGSGYGIIVTKGGNNEALYVNKTSGSGNAMAVVGGRTSLVDLSLSSVSNATGNFLTISGSVVHQRTAAETRSDVGAQAQLNGTGFVKASGTTISYDNSTYLTTAAAASTYLPLAGGTMTGDVNWGQTDRGITWGFNTDGASIKFYNTGDGDTNSRLEFATLDNNNEYFRWVHIPDGGSAYESMRLVPNSSGNAQLIVSGSIIKSGGTSSQFLKADGSVDSTAYGTGSVTSVAALTLGTTGTDLSSTVANGTTTPVITLNVPTASAANRGALSAADWTTFNSKENAITAGTTGQYYRGDKTFQTLNTSVVPELTNLYYTDGRARGALSFVAGSGAYNSSTGVITIPTNNNQITNGAGYITSAALGDYLPLTGGTLTGALGGTSANFSSSVTATSFIVNTSGQARTITTFYPSGSLGDNIWIGGGGLNSTTGGGSSSLGSLNTSLGVLALQNNTTGYRNTSVGYSSLRDNTTGHNNTSVGEFSMWSNTTGYLNSAFGSSSLNNNTTGYANSALGTNSLGYITTGRENVAVGFWAGFLINSGGNNTTSSNSTYLGQDTRASADGNTNEVVIGSGARGQGSNSVVIGNGSITKTILRGDVLIGTETPATGAMLNVNGSIRTAAPTGTSTENWRLGRALLATSSDPEDRWIRVQLGTKIYDILAIDRGDA
jgi:hypothetical protein